MSDLPAERDRAMQGLLDALEEPAALLRADGEIYAVNRAWTRPAGGLQAPGTELLPGDKLDFRTRRALEGPNEDLSSILARVLGGRRDEDITDIAIGPHQARIWFEMRLRRIPDSGLVLLSYRDISRRIHAEEQLRLSRSRLRSVIAGAPIVLLGLDNEGVFRVVEGVGASGLGATPELLIGRSVFEVYSHLPSLLNAVRGALAGETLAVAVPVGRLTYELRFSPTIDRLGRVRSVVGVATDITERTQIEQMKNEFVSVISHELRTPLTSIRGSLGLLEGGVGGSLSDDGQELVRIARSNSERLIRLINDILDLDKLEAGRLEFRNEPVRPAQLLRDAVAESQRFADDAGIEISARSAEDLPEIQGDPERLLQVLVKLTDNAIKFSPSPSRVRIEARLTEEGQVRFEIIDEGPGIAADQHKKIFKKFQQLESHSTRRSGGSGLGLVICKAIVDAHRGYLGLESETGKGSTFYVEFAPAGSRHAVRPPASGRGISGRTIDMNLAHVPDTKTRGLAEDLAELGADVVKAFEAGDVRFLQELHTRARELAEDLSSNAPEALGQALRDLAEALEHTDESLQRPPIENAFSKVLRASRGLN